MQWMAGVLLVSTFLLLPGCGFHPRGQLKASPELRCLKVHPHPPYDAFTQALDAALIEAKVQIDATEGCPVLEIHSHTVESNALAYSPTGLVRREQLQYVIEYSLSDFMGNQLITPRKLSTTRERLIDNNLEHADEFERSVLEDEMSTDLFAQIITQLQTRLLDHANQIKSAG